MNYFLKISLFFVLCSLISVLGCESKKDKIKNQKNIVTQKVKKQTSKNDNFKLSDENVMEFFLEYDKHNKENRIKKTIKQEKKYLQWEIIKNSLRDNLNKNHESFEHFLYVSQLLHELSYSNHILRHAKKGETS